MGNNLKLCMGCMSPMDDDPKCPVCGYYDGTPYLPSYLPPKTILNNRYIVGKLLRYNGEGATYIGYDNVTNKKVEVREFYPDTLCTRVPGSNLISINPRKLVQYKNLMSEFSELHKSLMKMRTLSHICSIYEVFNENNTSYIVSEFVDGKTLKHYLQDNSGEISWHDVKKLFPPIFTTLSLLHNSGIIHRGLSLDTIYYTNTGDFKISGFCTAAARTSNSDIAPELFAGFAAPEQYSSDSWQGTWTDVYSISAILYRCLSGCIPTESISRIGNDSLVEPSQINSGIPENVSNVITNGLKVNHKARIQTITELVTRLFDQTNYSESKRSETSTIIIPKQSVQQKKNNLSEDKEAKVKSSRIFLFVMGATLLCAILIVIFIFVFLGGENDKNNENDYNNPSVSADVSSDESSSVLTSSSVVDVSSENDKQKVLLPDFVGSVYENLNEFYTKNLKIIPTYDYNDKYEKGIIYEQDVEANKEVDTGSKINVKVSKGPKNVQIPEYAGLTDKDYVIKLNEAGIKYKVQPMESSEVAAGYVIQLSKSGTIDVSNNEELIVYVSVSQNGIN